MNKNIIITGISGFVGGSLANYYTANGFSVTGLSRSVCEKTSYNIIKTAYETEEIRNIISQQNPSLVIHGAGSASVADSLINPQVDFQKTVTLFHSLLEGIRLSDQKPLVVFPSSAAVYGNPEKLPVNESAPLKPISPYGYHKVICETLAREYSDCFSIPILVARLFSVFGSGQNRLLLWELFKQFQNNSEVVLQGTGNESRDYIYIDDLADAIMKVIPNLQGKYDVLNIASGRSLEIKDVAYKMKNLLRSSKPVSFKGDICAGNPSKWRAEISLFSKLAGDFNMPLFEGRLKEVLKSWKK